MLFRFARFIFRSLNAMRRIMPFSPRGPGTGDHHWLEKTINVLTCIPILMVPGFKGMGCIALLYHATPVYSAPRTIMRKLDYWSISASLIRANRSCNTSWMAVGIPFCPVGVSVTQAVLLMMQGNDAERKHKIFWAAISGGMFLINCMPKAHPLVHASWHCCAAKTLSLLR